VLMCTLPSDGHLVHESADGIRWRIDGYRCGLCGTVQSPEARTCTACGSIALVPATSLVEGSGPWRAPPS
jgi:uncharacterized OB-fold protein